MKKNHNLMILTLFFMLFLVSGAYASQMPPSSELSGREKSVRVDYGPTSSPTLTPTGLIGPLNVSGVVYAETDMSGNQLQDALVSCSISSSNICIPEEMTTDSDGTFAFDLGGVHETAYIEITAQKTDYISATFGFIALNCVSGCPEVTLILEAVEISATPTPTNSSTNTATHTPTRSPIHTPTLSPTDTPTLNPTHTSTLSPTHFPTQSPTLSPTDSPTHTSTLTPSDRATYKIYLPLLQLLTRIK